MRVREFRKNIWRSLDTTVRVSNRAQLVRYISAKLGRDGAPIPDDLIHVTHYGYDDRIDWDEHIIVVEGSGVFGFTDAPCPPVAAETVAGRDRIGVRVGPGAKSRTPPLGARRADAPRHHARREARIANEAGGRQVGASLALKL